MRSGGARVAIGPDISTRLFVTILRQLVKLPNKVPGKASTSKQAVEQVSELTTNRLSVYLRCLNALDDAGVRTISSQALAEQFHLNAAQIRKDLAYFGEFGVRGVGYYVRDLKRHLRQILGLDRKLRVAIMGAGNLGLALADYPGLPPGRLRDRGALRQPAARRSASSRAAACRSTTSTT